MIHFNSLISTFRLNNQTILKDWLVNAILNEGKVPGDLVYIFCSDDYLLEVNRKFLKHDYFTDIITFPTSNNPEIISGDIYLSIDRVYENSSNENDKFEREFARVLVHGVLHLIGYKDNTTTESLLMRSKEDYYLLLLPEI